jgi:hypothetical protein
MRKLLRLFSGLLCESCVCGSVEADLASFSANPDRLPEMQTQHIPVLEWRRPTAQHRIPAIYSYRQLIKEGGLMSYGPETSDIFWRSASYIDRILKGANPAELPAQAPSKFEFAINLKTATTLGLTVPPTVIALADEVIE